jgi:type III pantothenate kinase
MRSILTIDQGNTTCKLTYFRGDIPENVQRFDTLTIEDLAAYVDKYPSDGVIYCSVAHFDARFAETLCRLMGDDTLIFTHSTPLPIAIEYSTPNTLGLDRIAAAVGAASMFKGQAALVVDAGTALTIDVVDSDGKFKGGNISPGIDLRFRSLNHYTDALPLVKQDGEHPLFGNNTETAIRCGVIDGIVAEIADAYTRATDTYNVSHLLLTGGNAPFLADKLLQKNIHADVVGNLLALGLKYVYEYNSKNNHKHENK